MPRRPIPSSRPAHALRHWLRSEAGGNLAALAAEARRRLQLRDQLRRILPPEFAPHCLGAESLAQTLVVYVDSAAVSALLHYRQADLLAAAARAGLRCTNLRMRVLPEAAPGTAAASPTRGLATDVRRILERAADTLEDGALARALRRLARGPAPRE